MFILAYNYFVLQAAVKKLAREIFHEHKQLTEHHMKQRIEQKLYADELCVKFIQKSEEKGLTFDELCSKKILPSVCNVLICIISC